MDTNIIWNILHMLTQTLVIASLWGYVWLLWLGFFCGVNYAQ